MAHRNTSALIEQLGVRLPILQAPMAGSSTPAMAAASSNAGGLGSIAIGALPPVAAAAAIAEVQERTAKPFNVNVFCHRPARRQPAKERAWIARLAPEFQKLGAVPPHELHEIYQTFVGNGEMLKVVLNARPAVVSFHFGLPDDDALQALRAAGITMIATATNLREAQAVAAAGLDAVVAQGWEAGGHRGCFDPALPDDELGTIALTRMIAARTRLPVIAAGGLMDARGIRGALDSGASAVQLGTIFLRSDESAADAGHRDAVREASQRGTVMTRAISGRPARSVMNTLSRIGETVEAGAIPDYPAAYDLAKLLHAAALAVGDHGYGAYWAGTGAALAQTGPVRTIISSLAQELGW